MGRKYKCPICNKQDDESLMVKIGNRRYHKGTCEIVFQEEQESKEVNRNSWGKLFNYICELYGIDKPTGMMFKQLETFRKSYDYTDEGMYLTLKYYYETLNNEVLEGTGLGIIPYCYEEAKKHNLQIWDIETNLESYVHEEKNNVIKVKSFNTPYKERERAIINLGSIVWDEDE